MSDLPHQKPKPEQTKPNGTENADWHAEPFKYFTDLDAQKSMAQSTHWIVWVSVCGAVISIIGLCMLFITIRQNSRTLAHIKQASASELKPYFKITDIRVFNSKEPAEGFSFVSQFTVVNEGSTQAESVYIRIKSGTMAAKGEDDAPEIADLFYTGSATRVNVGILNPKQSHTIVSSETFFSIDSENMSHWAVKSVSETLMALNQAYALQFLFTVEIESADISTFVNEKRVCEIELECAWKIGEHSFENAGIYTLKSDKIVYRTTEDRTLG